MTKKEFVEKLQAKGAFESKAAAERAMDAVLGTIEDAMLEGETVQFVGWGTFEAKEAAARTGRNPKTGEEIAIPAKKVVKFKAGKGLADKVAGK
jgi:DNA-binding protein HU-beta